MIPSFDDIDELHRKYAPSQQAYELVYRHCMIVAEMVQELARKHNAIVVQQSVLADGACDTRTSAHDDGTQTQTTPDTNAFPPIFAHSRLMDTSKAVVGALLHDIGTYGVIDNDGSDGNPVSFDGPRYIMHGLIGYDLLKAEGVDEDIALFCRNHTGVGITAEQVRKQGLRIPEADYMPTTLEQEVVMYADNFNSKSAPPRFYTAQKAIARCAKFGRANEQRMSALVDAYGEPQCIRNLAQQYDMQIVDIKQ